MQGKSAWYDAVCPFSQVLSHISRVLPAQLGRVSSDPVWEACKNSHPPCCPLPPPSLPERAAHQGMAGRKEEET